MQGNELLETIQSLAAQGSAAVFMRHAHRYPILDPKEPTLAELTPEGSQMAEDFGSRITGYDHIRIYHSPVKRCWQTADCIARGARASGLTVEFLRPEEKLGVDYILDLSEVGRLTLLHGENFVRLWFTDQIPASVILPAQQIAETKLAFIRERLTDAPEGGKHLDIHVSHDWNVMILRDLMLGIRHEEAGWLTFLDGMGFSLAPKGLRAVYREQARLAGQ